MKNQGVLKTYLHCHANISVTTKQELQVHLLISLKNSVQESA
jgi:hypothetical protein